MEMEFSKLERVVGTFIVGVILLLMATVVILGRGKDWFEDYNVYYTSFKETYNLQDNAAVKLFRADIGKVSSITLEKDRVLVELAIQAKYASRIRQDAVAQVESPTLIGSEYIAIIPGSSGSPLIPKGGEILSQEKRSLNDILAEFQVEKTAKMVVGAIQEMAQISKNLSDPQGPLLVSLENVEKITTDVKKMAADLEAGQGPMGLILKSEDLLQRIVDNIVQLGEILTNINTVAAQAPRTMDLVQENLVTFRDTGASVQARVDQVQHILKDIQKAAADLQDITRNIRTGSYKIPQITTTFKAGIQEIRQGVEEVSRVVDSLQQNVLIRGNLPPEPEPLNTDAGARP
jgi:phospholipid/cholesterol/gamma-HCH transport system substrate-binding protein